MSSLKDRIASYVEAADHKLLAKLPVITIINGRRFSKLSVLLEKPFSDKLAECLYATLIKLTEEIEGVIFGYSFNDEIVIVSRNDQNLDTLPWCENKIQKMVSISASIATQQFNNYATSIDLNLIGDPTFYSQVFAVPNLTEAINTIIAKQQQAFQSSVYFACVYELLKKYDKNDIREMLSGTTIDDKINLLQQECGIDYNEYPEPFRRGVACYRAPKVVIYDGVETIKHKWGINLDLPIFTKDQQFLNGIFRNGKDILRSE
jgi:tRNA(His) guanylyltransferase